MQKLLVKLDLINHIFTNCEFLLNFNLKEGEWRTLTFFSWFPREDLVFASTIVYILQKFTTTGISRSFSKVPLCNNLFTICNLLSNFPNELLPDFGTPKI